MATMIMKNEEPVIIDESISGETYLGYPLLGEGLNEDQPVWGIKLVQAISGETQLLYPNGSKMKKFVWEDREDYTYLPFAAKTKEGGS